MLYSRSISKNILKSEKINRLVQSDRVNRTDRTEREIGPGRRGPDNHSAFNLTTFWIDTGHHMPDDAVFAGCIHSLKNQQQRITAGCIVKALPGVQRFYMFFQEYFIPFF